MKDFFVPKDLLLFSNNMGMNSDFSVRGFSAGVGESMGTLTVTVTVSAVASTEWTPAEITTALWLDAADSDTITLNGATVSEWRDKSGNARHATQSTEARQPLFDADGWDGTLPALILDGVDDMLITTLALSNQHSVFYVAERGVQTESTDSILRPVIGARVTLGTSNSGLRSYGTQRGTLTNLEFYAESSCITTISGSWKVAEKIIASAIHNGSILEGRKNAGLYGTIALTTTSSHPVYIGGDRFEEPTVRYFAGKIAEIVICPTAVDEFTRQKIEGYLAHKWGLAANLPADHPYKSAPPTI